MSKPAKAAPVVTVAPSEKSRAKPEDVYPAPVLRVPMRVPRGNNEYDIVIATYEVPPTAVYVSRARISRMEADYELKLLMQRFVGLNRYGPSAPEEQQPMPPDDTVKR